MVWQPGKLPFFLLACELLALLPITPIRADEAEDKAVAFVRKVGGSAYRDKKAPGQPVNYVYLQGKRVKDEEMLELAPLQNLKKLKLDNTRVSDAGVQQLQQMLPNCMIRR